MAGTNTEPSTYTTTGTGDGSDIAEYNEQFGLLASDGSGNPSESDAGSSDQRSHYNKDLDLVQNMRNCFAVVKGFKEQVDAIVLASGYGGWTIITESVAPEDRIEGLMYLRVTSVTTGKNADGQTVPKYKIQAETHDGTIISYFSDADTSNYDNEDSYYLTATTVKDALDELSHRSIILKATIPVDSWTLVSSDTIVGETYYYAEVDVPGMLSTDYPSVTLEPASNATTAANQIANVGHISRIQTMNDKIKAYCYDGFRPSYSIPLIFRIQRGGQA